jgi:hypothetical protein
LEGTREVLNNSCHNRNTYNAKVLGKVERATLGIFLDRIYRITWIFLLAVPQMRTAKPNRLRRIKMEIIYTNLNKLIQVVMKKQSKTFILVTYFIPLKAD